MTASRKIWQINRDKRDVMSEIRRSGGMSSTAELLVDLMLLVTTRVAACYTVWGVCLSVKRYLSKSLTYRTFIFEVRVYLHSQILKFVYEGLRLSPCTSVCRLYCPETYMTRKSYIDYMHIAHPTSSNLRMHCICSA